MPLVEGATTHFLEPRREREGRLRYLKAGTGAPLVLLHTVRTQAEHFRYLIPMVSDRYTVYALDLPGMGHSDMRIGVERLLTQLDLRDATLLGESIGAVLAVTAAADHPERVRRIVADNLYDYPGGIVRSGLLARLIVPAIIAPAAVRCSPGRKSSPSRVLYCVTA